MVAPLGSFRTRGREWYATSMPEDVGYPHDDDEPIEIPSDDEIERRLKRISESLREPEFALSDDDEHQAKLDDTLRRMQEGVSEAALHDTDADFDKRLRDLQQRAHRTNAIQQNKKQQARKSDASAKEGAGGLALGMTIAYTIIGLPLLGALAGFIINLTTRHSEWTGICVLVGAVTGIVLTVVMLNRANGQS